MTAGLPAAGACARPSGAGAATVEEVADGVFAFVQPDGGWCLNNAGIVVGSDGCVLVDTAATRARAETLRRAALRVQEAAPKIVVDTHFHGDHTFGNCVFPEATVVGHQRTRTAMAGAGLHLTTLWPDVCWGAIDLALPTVTYRDRLTLHTGATTLELSHPGPAHTTDDTVVWLPGQRVLFTGDLVMSGVTPFIAMGSLSGSLDALAALRALRPAVVVPGHGPVGGPGLLDAAEGYLRHLETLAREGLRAGRTPLEAARRADLGPYARLLDAERLVPNLHRAYAELDGAKPGADLDITELFADMVRFHGALPPCRA
ncbi:MBL fold metallo-hydrolase [Streptomyces sp. NPDC005395]|uniref:MBL fold metallo-hydrolase n=1 Tax=Streptomyces sp. NPDC005395 TaxID=3157042 RepID=UPI0033BCBECF